LFRGVAAESGTKFAYSVSCAVGTKINVYFAISGCDWPKLLGWLVCVRWSSFLR